MKQRIYWEKEDTRKDEEGRTIPQQIGLESFKDFDSLWNQRKYDPWNQIQGLTENLEEYMGIEFPDKSFVRGTLKVIDFKVSQKYDEGQSYYIEVEAEDFTE